MTMLEKAAVALMNRQRNRYGLSSIDIGMFDPEEIERAKDLSRAVLMAVRWPDEAALTAACEIGPDTNNGCFSCDDTRTIYVAMVEAILNEDSTK